MVRRSRPAATHPRLPDRAGRRAKRDQGAAAVEFALVTPPLLLLLFGIVQYGYGFFQLQAAQAAVREAARTASVGIDACTGAAGTLTSWDEVVDSATTGNGLSPVDVTRATLTFDNPDVTAPAAPVRGDTVTAEITYTPGLRFPLVPFPDSITRRATTTVEDVGGLAVASCLRSP